MRLVYCGSGGFASAFLAVFIGNGGVEVISLKFFYCHEAHVMAVNPAADEIILVVPECIDAARYGIFLDHLLYASAILTVLHEICDQYDFSFELFDAAEVEHGERLSNKTRTKFPQQSFLKLPAKRRELRLCGEGFCEEGGDKDPADLDRGYPLAVNLAGVEWRFSDAFFQAPGCGTHGLLWFRRECQFLLCSCSCRL